MSVDQEESQTMQERFYVSHNGEEVGPFSMEEIFEKLKTRQLWSVDYVYLEEKADWITLEEFSLVFDAIKTERIQVDPPVADSPMAKSSVVALPVLELPVAEPPVVELPLAAPVAESPIIELPVAAPAAESPPLSFDHLTPQVEAPVAAAPASPQAPFEVQLVDGVAVVEFTHETAGILSLSLVDQGAKHLALANHPEIQVKAARAVQIHLKAEPRAIAGEPVTVHFEATDAFGNLDEAFTAELQVQFSGSAQGGGAVPFRNGKAQCTLSNQKAETITLSFSGLPASMKAPKTHTLQFVAGPAVQYLIETPKQTVAGEPTQVTIRAVDAFGNPATEAKGPIQLVKNSKPQVG